MSLRKFITFFVVLLVGVALGFIAAWVIEVEGKESMAKASVFAAGEALRSGDLVMSMNYAQSAIAFAPEAYDGYEFVGDVYLKQGYTQGAKRMYGLALEKLETGQANALLVQEGTNSIATARELLQRKLAPLE